MKFVIDLLGFIIKIIPDVIGLITNAEERKKKKREERKAEAEREAEAERVRERIKNERPSTIADWDKPHD